MRFLLDVTHLGFGLTGKSGYTKKRRRRYIDGNVFCLQLEAEMNRVH